MATTIWPTIAEAVKNAKRTAVAPLTWNPVDHLLSRFAFGPTPADRTWLANNGPDAWYKSQVNAAKTYAGYAGNSSVAAQGPLLRLNPYDYAQWVQVQGRDHAWDAMNQLTRVTLGLQGWSVAQLYETLVDFFSNHLHVPNHAEIVLNTRHTYDRDVIRRYATGSFTDMLLASAKHPAMLAYLSLAESTKQAVNENYGRELLELHTVGLHYTEDDVKNTARLLTGRTFDFNQHYVYDDYVHWTGAVKVLGFSNANSSAVGGEKAGDDLLRYLAASAYTAQNLARKMCVRFVSDDPSSTLVNAVAKAYTDGKTQILPMISTILRSTEFWESRGRKVRRPAENLIAAVRVTGAGVSNWASALTSLHWMTYSMGHTPLEWPAPNGYPDVATAWRSTGTLLQLWELHLGLVGGWYDGFKAVDVNALYDGAPANSGDAINRLTKHLTGTAWSPTHRSVLQTMLGEATSVPMVQSILRWWEAPLAAVVLDSPHHALR